MHDSSTATTTPTAVLDDGAAARIRQAAADGPIVFITGAGISVASGIGTYRGTDGLWTRGGTAAMAHSTLAFYLRHPEKSWAWHLDRRSEMRHATPNAAHHAIAHLQQVMGERCRVITQNIDRLHVAAGDPGSDVIELHGHLDGMRCSAWCEGVLPIPDHYDDWTAGSTIGDADYDHLECPRCGYATRPHVLWFDEMYDETHYRARTAHDRVIGSAVCITVGTSGGVPIAPRLATIAHRSGALLVDINPTDTDVRRLVAASDGIVVDAPATTGVPAVVDAIVGAAR